MSTWVGVNHPLGVNDISRPLKNLGQIREESGQIIWTSPDTAQDVQQGSVMPENLYSDVSMSSNISDDEIYRMDSQQAFALPQAPSHTGSLAGITKTRSDVSEATVVADLGSESWTSVSPGPFNGYVETSFSSAKGRYYYQGSKEQSYKGHGGFSTVEEVFWYNPATGGLEECVAKTLKVERASTHSGGWEGWKADGFRERSALLRVATVPGVVRLLRMVYEDNGAVHLIMERAAGLPLSVRIEQRDLRSFGLTWRQMRSALVQVAQALAGCHNRGVLHGDLKPPNIMSTRRNTSTTLIDFGAASISDGSDWEYQGGTGAYTAPELLTAGTAKQGTKAADCFTLCGPPVDYWAFGATAFELLTGSCLFAPDFSARPKDLERDSDAASAWAWLYIARLHKDWALGEGTAIHTKFHAKLQQLAAVGEDFHRQGVEFLRRLLDPDPAQRMSVAGALHHPFLTGDFPGAAQDALPPAMERPPIILEDTGDRELWEACGKMCGQHQKRGGE